MNKNSKLVIVASTITVEIKQTAMYLRRKGIDIYCVEFKYFSNHENSKMISSDFVVADDEFLKIPRSNTSSQLPKTNKEKFLQSLDENGKFVFENLSKFAEKEKLVFRWGSKGFSLNKTIDNGFIGLCFGYPLDSVFKQSLYSGFEEIKKKVNNAESGIDFYRAELIQFKKIEDAKSNLKWVINKKVSQSEIDMYLEILRKVVSKIEMEGLRNE